MGGNLKMEIYQRIMKFCKDVKDKTKQTYVNNKSKVKPLLAESKTKITSAYSGFKERFKGIMNIDNKKTTYIAVGITAVLLVSVIGYTKNYSPIAYEIKMDGKVLGIVRTEDEFKEAVDAIKKEIKTLYGHEFVMPEDVEILEVKAKDDELTKTQDIIYNIKKQMDMKVKAYALVVDGEEIGCVKDKAIAKSILEEIKLSYVDEDTDYEAIDFKEKVNIEEVARGIEEIKDEEEILNFLIKGTDEEAIHVVEAGENTWTIAKSYGIPMEDIHAANPGLVPERLQIGQEISLIVPKPYLTVVTKEYVELTEEIPFETETQPTDSLYEGDKKIIAQGLEGEREIKGYLIKENGVEVDREVLEEKILKEPVTRVIAEGTKERPLTVATGTFARPTRGRLTSGFGMRWGRRHEGIDIGAPIGTHITAADAGRVSFAGTKGAYGKLVIIDHENGYQTYYAHASKIHVKQGDRVYKGQHIANVGNTGRSTGPHLHFEVRKNGVPVNPSQFVKY